MNMKRFKTLILTSLFLLVFVFLSGCQIKEVSNVEGSDKTVQDYNKLFELKLYSDKQVYKTTDKIMIWATLKYIGSKDQITIWHGDPYINFYISDGKEFNIGGIVNTILTTTTLERNKLYKFDYIKNGGYSNDDTNAEFWKKFYSEKDLILPEGEYIIKVGGGFSLSEKDTQSSNLSEQISIKVEK